MQRHVDHLGSNKENAVTLESDALLLLLCLLLLFPSGVHGVSQCMSTNAYDPIVQAGAQLQTTWRSAKTAATQPAPLSPPPRHKHRQKLRHHGPQQHSLHCVHLSLLPDRMSSDSGEELNLRNLHCLQRQPRRSLYMLRCSHSWNTSFSFFIFFFVSSFSFSSSNSSILGSSPSLPSSSTVVFLFPRISHFFLLRFFHVELDGKADEL